LISAAGTFPEKESPASFDIEKIKLEVGRALQYFKQQVRNENIGRILLFGNSPHADEIEKLLGAFFRIPVTKTLLPEKTFGAIDSITSPDEVPPLFTIPHIVSLHAHFEKYIDFLPQDLRQQKQIKVRGMALASSAAALYVMICGVGLLYHREASEISRTEQSTRQIRQLPADSTEKIQQALSIRSFAVATAKSHEWLQSRHQVLGSLIRELADIVPSEMRISKLMITEEGNTWHVALQAEIKTPNGSRSQQLLSNFQNQMQRMPCLDQLDWGDVQLADASPGIVSRNLLTFTMEGTLQFPASQTN
jgi:hypothetical protein